MTVEELESLARQWARGQIGIVVYPDGSERYELRKQELVEARKKINELGYQITTDDWGNVVIVMPFKV